MTNQQQYQELYTITEAYVQEIAESNFETKLTPDQLTWVQEKMIERTFELAGESISEVIEHDDLFEQNKNAEQANPHFKVYYRNKNIFSVTKSKEERDNFDLKGTFKSIGNAKKFIKLEDYQSEDEWKIVKVKNDVEQDIFYECC